MEQIKTTNLISTPNIEGNIGSCETKSMKEKSASGVITDTYQVVMTNSCNGQIVKEYQYVDYGMVLPFIGFVVFMFLVLIVMSLETSSNRY